MKTFFALMLALSLVFLLGCQSLSRENVAHKISKKVVEYQNPSENITIPFEVATESGTMSTSLSEVPTLSFDTKYYGGEGYLHIVVENPRIVKSTDQLNLDGFSTNESYVAIFSKNIIDEFNNHAIEELFYPNFIAENGDFVVPVSMVLADVIIENVGADNGGRYDDPYVFNASIVGSIIDPDGNILDNDDPRLSYGISYYSKMGTCEESYLAFRLEPGETITFQAGWLIGNKMDGTTIDFSDFRLGNDSLSLPISLMESE